jgi:pimeloyl-ACP methyl ester carboxylesterase
MQREIQLPQGVLRYRDVGEGRPLVFVHGVFTDGRLWDPVVGHLQGRFRCVVPDWPLGAHLIAMRRRADMSPRGVAQLITDFMAALDLHDVTLIGNDTGGALCQIVVTERPERVGRLVLTNCDAFENFPPPMFRYLRTAAAMPFGLALLGQGMRPAIARRLPFAFGWVTRTRIPSSLTASWARPLRTDRHVRRDIARFLRASKPEITVAAAERLPRFDRPVLIVWGTGDRFMPVEHAERLAVLIPDSTLTWIDGGRTFLPLDEPGRVAAAVADFVAAGERAHAVAAPS